MFHSKTLDPVCGMKVDRKSAEFTAQHQGRTYYFCASACKEAFAKEPQKFAAGGPKGGGCHCC